MARTRASLVLAVLAVMLLPGLARAGAWTLPKGSGQVIVSGLYSEALQAFDEGGSPQEIPLFQKAEVNLYAEYGMTDGLTLVLRSEVKTYASGKRLSPEAARFGLSGGGARLRLWQGRDSVLSAEIVGRIATPFDDRVRQGEHGGEVDLRLMAGRGFDVGRWTGFADVQAAYRLGLDDRSDALIADMTLGLRPRPWLLLMAQSFNTLPLENGDTAFVEPTEHKLALSAVYDVNPRLSLQFGGVATIAGRDALAERALVTAAWFRF